ncbi:MAG: YfiR family protein [Pseudomonadota bacterium]
MKLKPIVYKALTAMLLGLLVTITSRADSLPEYKMKAAFLYNFVQLTEWPKSSETLLRICVVGQDPIVEALQDIEGSEVNGRRIKVVQLPDVSGDSLCDALYLSESESIDVKGVISKLGESPVLTVSDNIDVAKSGVMISMFPMSKRLVFNVNAESAKRAHLTLSSRLLRLAKHVD